MSLINKNQNRTCLYVAVCYFLLALPCISSTTTSDYLTTEQQDLSAVKIEKFALPLIQQGPIDKELPQPNTTYAFEYRKGRRIAGDELLISDKRSFVFPLQDVALLIQYPKKLITASEKQFLITQIILRVYQDGLQNDGYITNGGIMTTRIGLKLVSAKVTRFQYEIIIYGLLRDMVYPGVEYEVSKLPKGITVEPSDNNL